MVKNKSTGGSVLESATNENSENILSGEAFFNAISKTIQESEESFDICPPIELLSDFDVSDSIDSATKDLIKEHLDQCDICKELVDDNQICDKDTTKELHHPSYSSEILWNLRIEYMKANHPERLYIPDENEALKFDMENISPLYGVAAEPFRESQRRYYGTDEISSNIISGIVIWHKKGIEICRACVNVQIVFEEFQGKELSISGYLVKDSKNWVPPFAKWHCAWKTDRADVLPDRFVYDKDSGHFTAGFPMQEKIAGRFMLLFVAQI